MEPRIARIVLVTGLVLSSLVGGLLFTGQAQAQREPLTIESNKTSYAAVGEMVMFYYTLTNTVGAQLYDLEFTDNLGKVPCSVEFVNANMQTGCTRQYTITQDDMDRGSIDITAEVTGKYTIGGCLGKQIGQVDYTATLSIPSSVPVRVFKPNPVLQMAIAGDPASFSGPGEVVTYSYTLTNAGNVALTGPFTIDDTLAPVSCPATDVLDLNASFTCTASYTTTAADVLAGRISSTAIAHARYQEETRIYSVESASVTTEIPLAAQPALSLVKTATPGCFTELGETIKFTFTITNTGNVPLEGPFQLVDSYIIPSSLSCTDTATLNVGESIVCSGSYQTMLNDIAQGFSNKAVVTAQYNGQTVTSNEATVYVCYIPPVTACSKFTEPSICDSHPECKWVALEEVCKNKR